jgi:hypothetical protein
MSDFYDFTVEAQLAAAKQLLVVGIPKYFSTSNVIITAAAHPINALAVNYAEIYDGGGMGETHDQNLYRRWTMGVSLYAKLVVDQVQRFEESSKNMRLLSHYVRMVLHNHMPDPNFPEPITFTGDTPVRVLAEIDGLMTCDLRFSILSIIPWDDILAARTELAAGLQQE